MIEARIVKGFRDALPHEEYIRSQIIERLAHTFYGQGYQPIDTPILEYTQTLLGKSGGETEKQIFRFTDAGDRDVAMRFDLTVPLARYVAMHKEELGLPFKRYHIAKVWRGEKPQRGRFREFYQCDFDLVGANSGVADLDILLTAYHALRALGVNNFVIEINHRGILLDYLTQLQLEQHNAAILRVIDKVDKVGWQAVHDELASFLSPSVIEQLHHFTTSEASLAATLAKIEVILGSESQALQRLKWIFEQCSQLGLASVIQFNPKITRGLDYYTGMVFETFLLDDRSLGSICSGGRYDQLLNLYTKENIGGVGGSIGLDRLLSAKDLLSSLAIEHPLRVMVYYQNNYLLARELVQALQQRRIVAEIYPDEKKIDNQTKYALRKGIVWALFIEEGSYTLRNLEQKSSERMVSQAEVVEYLEAIAHG